MKIYQIILIIILPMSFLGCDNNKNEISASATSTITEDGEIIVREANHKEINSVNNFSNNMKSINKNYPRPELPLKQKTYRVISISNSGIFLLDDGKKVKMAGIICDEQGISFINKFFAGEEEKLAFSSPETSSEDGAMSSYIWQVDSSLMNDPKTKDIFIGPSFSGMNDTVILNNWCEIDHKNKSKFHLRYTALEKISYKHCKN